MLLRARGTWQELASVPVSFGAPGDVDVVVSPDARICPRGWAGIVLLGGAAIVTAPTEAAADRIRKAVAEVPADKLTDLETVRGVLTVGDVLGPATLAYVAPDGFRPAELAGLSVEQWSDGYGSLDGLVEASGANDADEAGLDEISSPAFGVRMEGQVVAAAGYGHWPRLRPSRTAHMMVLTAPTWRGKGLARVTASAAVRHALEQGLLPQWRARTPASRKTAAALGFTELGSQLSIELV
ncbi:GNAT family N-acetyltransferase [Streptomyces sp. NPDC001852]|uniref:GNAT family N-acetyltransferase n=1 Tax=Streptomyces sp. NPDC001852 TaxID=3364619 RepID=UPI0036907D60